MDLPHPYNLWKIRAKACIKNVIENEMLPISVTPQKVKITHNKEYEKGPWKIKLSKYWEAENNLEAESLQLKGSKYAKFKVEVELKKPWELMEQRGSSDNAMSGAILERAFYLINSIPNLEATQSIINWLSVPH